MRLVCYFSGWFESDLEDVKLQDMETGKIKTAAEWLEEKGNIDGLILENFEKASSDALDGEFDQLEIKILSDD